MHERNRGENIDLSKGKKNIRNDSRGDRTPEKHKGPERLRSKTEEVAPAPWWGEGRQSLLHRVSQSPSMTRTKATKAGKDAEGKQPFHSTEGGVRSVATMEIITEPPKRS